MLTSVQVVFTGHETKLMKNATSVFSFFSLLELV